jgi:hypothetical protein
MDTVNQPQGQRPEENSPTQPYRFTPGWPGITQGGPGYGAPTGGPQWQQAGPPPPGPQGPYHPQGPQGPYGPQWQHGAPGARPPHPKKDWKHFKRVRWTAGITTAALLGAGGAAAGLALTGSGGTASNAAQAVALNTALSGISNCPTPVPGSLSGGTSGKPGERGCLRLRLREVKGMYGQIAYHAGNGTQTLAFERGRVVSDHAGVLVIKAGNGTEWSWNVASSSIVRESGKPVPSSLLSPGANVFVGGQVVGSSKDARLIVIHKKKKPGGSSGQNPSGQNSSNTNSPSGSAT